jgi:hypothetical protein
MPQVFNSSWANTHLTAGGRSDAWSGVLALGMKRGEAVPASALTSRRIGDGRRAFSACSASAGAGSRDATEPNTKTNISPDDNAPPETATDRRWCPRIRTLPFLAAPFAIGGRHRCRGLASYENVARTVGHFSSTSVGALSSLWRVTASSQLFSANLLHHLPLLIAIRGQSAATHGVGLSQEEGLHRLSSDEFSSWPGCVALR